ncbi:MAG: hypothetical protein LKE37_01135 [Atopobiaceae bacterium]|jgi:hypothetical protein|nr:hypothetical protein [Atopobiaceae bacterium]
MLVRYPHVILGDAGRDEALRGHYESYVAWLVGSDLAGIDSENVSEIVVPSDFANEVIRFQIDHGCDRPGLTDNEFGRAVGKTLDMGDGAHYAIYLDQRIGFFLLEEEALRSLVSELGYRDTDAAGSLRERAVGVLAHELAHAEYRGRVSVPDLPVDMRGQITLLSFRLLDEYYACRRSARYSKVPVEPFSASYVHDIEDAIIEKRDGFCAGAISDRDFDSSFFGFARRELIELLSTIATGIGREEAPHDLTGFRGGAEVVQISNSFDSLYEDVRHGRGIEMPDRVVGLIGAFYESFGVRFSEDGECLRWEITE